MSYWKCNNCGAPLEEERCKYCRATNEKPREQRVKPKKDLRNLEYRIYTAHGLVDKEMVTSCKTYTYAELIAAGHTDDSIRQMLSGDRTRPEPTSVPGPPLSILL